jgi:hypothetical protein
MVISELKESTRNCNLFVHKQLISKHPNDDGDGARGKHKATFFMGSRRPTSA